MKKGLIVILVMLGIFSACNKEKIDPPNTGGNVIEVSFEKDISMTDISVQAPKNNQVVFSGKSNTGSVNGFQLTSVEISLTKGGDAISPKDYLRRIYFTIEDADGVSYTSTIKDSVVNNSFSFDNFLKNYGQFKTLIIKLHADILPGATNGTGLEDNLVVSIRFFYTEGGSAVPRQTKVVVGQKITFSSAPQTFMINSYSDSTNPTGSMILEGQNIEVFRYGISLSGHSGSVTSHRLLVQGPGASAITALKLFSGTTLVGQGNVSGGICTIATNDALSAGMRKFYSLVPTLLVNPNSSNYDFSIVLDEVKGVSTSGEQKSDGSDRVSNLFTPLKTNLIVERIPISTQLINDSTEADTYQLRITNTGNFPASFTQISYALTWADNSPGGVDTLQLKPRLLCDGVQCSGFWTDQNGDTALIGGFFKETTSIVTFTFTTEYNISAGSSVVVTLKTFRKGFKTVNDGFRVRSVFDASRVDPSYKFVNQGTVGLSRKLFSSSAQSSSANAFKQLFIYSDKCDPAHSPVPGLSSKDWLNGYGFPDLPDQVWVR